MPSKPNETPQSQADELADIMAELDQEEADLTALILADTLSKESKLTELQKSFRERKKKEQQRFKDATDSEYWFCVCFLTREQKGAFLKAANWGNENTKYIDGVKLSKGIGFELPPADLRFVTEKPDKRLDEISLPLTQ